MKIAILSDIHDNIWEFEKVKTQINGIANAIIYCGDFCAPFTAGALSKLNIPVYACLGNNDSDQIGLVRSGGPNFIWTSLGQEIGVITLENRNIAYCHYPRLAHLVAAHNDFDAVFFGHTHQAEVKNHDKTLLMNPGAVCGIQNGVPGAASYGMYDTTSNSAEIIVLEGE